jgi:ATP-dependent DNA ligase
MVLLRLKLTAEI